MAAIVWTNEEIQYRVLELEKQITNLNTFMSKLTPRLTTTQLSLVTEREIVELGDRITQLELDLQNLSSQI